MATPANPLRDPNTLSNYNKFRTVHTSVNFEIRFDQKRLVGNVIHRLKSLTNAESKEVILDSSYLEVKSVKVNGEAAEWQLLPRFEPYGSPLKISLEQAIPLDELIEVDSTRPRMHGSAVV
ncbi:hypothetical protein CIHG_10266 [Coccidioides immitis H538.4]|uniref:Uncharacterized protein n=1 Tax=Coccidioides immitis H538.4 TaxID=396776 RepID=A0A0J8S5R6_COCIT|nr:hypothetical protein CIHG_10266 [Coccidioides immitis H538.4]